MSTRVSSEERRAELIAEALRQYVTVGLEATTRTSLAGALGVDRVIVHRLYPDLDALFDDVVEHVRSVGFEEIAAVAASVDELARAGDLWELLVGRIVAAARSHPLEWAFLFLTPPNPEVAARLDRLRTEVAELAIGELVARADAPATDEERRELAWGATFVYQGLFGSVAAHLATGDEADDEHFVRTLAEVLDELIDVPASLTAEA